MKRMWIGAVLLVLLLVAGILVGEFMERTHCPDARILERAAARAMAGDWVGARQLSGSAEAGWLKRWRLTAAVVDHNELETVDSLFSELEIYAVSQDQPHYSATCVSLASLLEAIGRTHSFSWWNLL